MILNEEQSLTVQLEEATKAAQPYINEHEKIENKYKNYQIKASKIITEHLQNLKEDIGLHSDTTIEFQLKDKYQRIIVKHPSYEWGYEISINVVDYDKHYIFRDKDLEDFDPKKAKYEISTVSTTVSEDNFTATQLYIIYGWLNHQFVNREEESFFSILGECLNVMYDIADILNSISEPMFEKKKEITKIKDKIKTIDELKEKKEFIEMVTSSIGTRYKLKEKIGRTRCIGDLFNDSYYEYAMIEKATDKTVTLQFERKIENDSNLESDSESESIEYIKAYNKRIKIDVFKKYYKYLEVVD